MVCLCDPSVEFCFMENLYISEWNNIKCKILYLIRHIFLHCHKEDGLRPLSKVNFTRSPYSHQNLP